MHSIIFAGNQVSSWSHALIGRSCNNVRHVICLYCRMIYGSKLNTLQSYTGLKLVTSAFAMLYIRGSRIYQLLINDYLVSNVLCSK